MNAYRTIHWCAMRVGESAVSFRRTPKVRATANEMGRKYRKIFSVREVTNGCTITCVFGTNEKGTCND